MLSFLLSVKNGARRREIVFPMALYSVEAVHRRPSRRLQPTPAHAANVLGSLFAGIRAASHRLPTWISGTMRGRIESETRFASFSSAASTSGTPRTFFDPSSTPMTTIPPPVFANATRHLRMLSGDDKSRLYSRVFPSWRFSSSTSLTTPHSTRKHSSLQGFRVRRHRQPQNNGSKARRCCSTPIDRGKTVSKLFSLEPLGLALSEKQVPQIVETIRSVEN